MKICLPERFNVKYPKENKAYYTSKNSPILRELLSLASDSYCMYCGISVKTDGKEDFHLEHSVDKEGNYNQIDKRGMLRNCKFNFSVACSRCNLVYKKHIEKLDFDKYELVEKCPKECTVICDTYKQMHQDYCEFNSIILQPLGYKKKEVQYKIKYNLLRHIYEADVDIKDKDALFFIEHHIMRFHLNSENFSKNIVNICIEIYELYVRGIVNTKAIIEFEEEKRHENIIGKLFVRFLKEKFWNSENEELIEFCKMLVVLDVII